jgi:hypothetical protein
MITVSYRLASRNGAACRRLHPQTRRPPAAPGAADGLPKPAWRQSRAPGVMRAARVKTSRPLTLMDAQGLLLRIISSRNEQR